MRVNSSRSSRVWLAGVLVVSLGACGGGGGGGGSTPRPVASTPPPPPPPVVDNSTPNRLSGSVGDGPIVEGLITVFDDQGVVVKEIQSDASASYYATVRVDASRYPLRIEATGGIDLVTGAPPDFTLTSIAMRPAERTVGNINPHSTLVVEAALNLNAGPTANAIASGRTTVLQQLNFGLDNRLLSDPLTSEIDGINVAMIVKSSEGLGEMIRRTRDALIGTGTSNADQVVAAIGADLVDGIVDGRGASATDTRIAALSHLVSAQVLFELLTNDLRVNGMAAAASMDAAILQIRPNSAADTDSVVNPAPMLRQAVTAVEAAYAFNEDPNLLALADAIRDLPADTLAADVRGLLPAASESALQAAIDQAVVASDSELEVVNLSVRSADEINPAPVHFSLEAATASVVEGKLLEVRVLRDASASSASVEWRAVDETARADDDYRAAAGDTLTFAPGQTSLSITIDALFDGVVESDETLRIELLSATGGELGSPAITTVTIIDTGDAPPPPSPDSVFTLSASTLNVSEGQTATLKIRRTETAEAASVDWQTEDTSATSGEDYTGVGRTTVFFAAGEAEQTIRVTTIDDATSDDGETFNLRLLSPSSGASIGSPSSATITISDDDVAPPPPTGIATLSWTPPTERIDGSVLDDLAGYEVHFGQSETNLDRVIVLDNAGLSSYVVEELGSGTWYFAMTAVDGEDRRSALSMLGSKTFP
jgi:hypothetical protein